MPRRDALRLWGFSEKVGYFGKIHKIFLKTCKGPIFNEIRTVLYIYYRMQKKS